MTNTEKQLIDKQKELIEKLIFVNEHKIKIGNLPDLQGLESEIASLEQQLKEQESPKLTAENEQELFNKIEQGVSDYLKKVGSVDRKDITEWDFREGISLGLTIARQQQPDLREDIINCIINYDKTASLEEKGRYFETIQRDLIKQKGE
jgi:hypothetical protein